MLIYGYFKIFEFCQEERGSLFNELDTIEGDTMMWDVLHMIFPEMFPVTFNFIWASLKKLINRFFWKKPIDCESTSWSDF